MGKITRITIEIEETPDAPRVPTYPLPATPRVCPMGNGPCYCTGACYQTVKIGAPITWGTIGRKV